MEPEEIEEVVLPTRTYAVQDGRIVSQIDGIDAMRQAVEKILLTARFCVPWLSPDYGNDLDDLMGKSLDYAKSDVERIILEAFSDDERIENVEVEDIQEVNKTSLLVKMTVETTMGDIEIEKEAGTYDTE